MSNLDFEIQMHDYAAELYRQELVYLDSLDPSFLSRPLWNKIRDRVIEKLLVREKIVKQLKRKQNDFGLHS